MFKPKNRSYTEWEITGNAYDKTNIDPISLKMLMGDIISENGSVEYVSQFRSMENIPGVLVYGKHTYGKRGNKPLYKCIPDNPFLPEFLVPFVTKHTGFRKDRERKYILFKFVEWEGKHPIGVITNTIGDASNLDAFYDYQIYCKDVYSSIRTFTNTLNKRLNTTSVDKSNVHEDRTKLHVFTIDPEGSLDFDDAMGIQRLENRNIVSVYISDVPFWLNELGLWQHLSERVTTIYLPGKKYPMLPPKLSDGVCSLYSGEDKYAVSMDVSIGSNGDYEVSFKMTNITVNRNYVYDEEDMLKDSDYCEIRNYAEILNKKRNYLETIKDSHDVVAYFMIMMNHEVGKFLHNEKTGIYRSVVHNENDNVIVPDKLRHFMNIWKNTTGKYENYQNQKGHAFIGNSLDVYLHVTSPIRRMVDLVNIVILRKKIGMASYDITDSFVEKWLDNISFINEKSKSVQKVQRDCLLLKQCIEYPQKQINGYIIERFNLENIWKYNVYLPELNMLSEFRDNTEYKLYDDFDFHIITLMDEVTLKQKIRLQIVG